MPCTNSSLKIKDYDELNQLVHVGPLANSVDCIQCAVLL